METRIYIRTTIHPSCNGAGTFTHKKSFKSSIRGLRAALKYRDSESESYTNGYGNVGHCGTGLAYQDANGDFKSIPLILLDDLVEWDRMTPSERGEYSWLKPPAVPSTVEGWTEKLERFYKIQAEINEEIDAKRAKNFASMEANHD